MIKICSLSTSPSPLLFKFIRSLLPQPPSGRSQRPCPTCSPRGTHNRSSSRSVKTPALGRLTSLLRGSSKPRTCSAANARQEEAAETTGFGYSLTLDKLRKKDRNHCPWGVQKQDLTPRNTKLRPAVSKEKRLARSTWLPTEPIFMSCWILPHLASRLPVIIFGSKESSGQPSDALRKQLHWIKKTVHLCKKQYILFF